MASIQWNYQPPLQWKQVTKAARFSVNFYSHGNKSLSSLKLSRHEFIVYTNLFTAVCKDSLSLAFTFRANSPHLSNRMQPLKDLFAFFSHASQFLNVFKTQRCCCPQHNLGCQEKELVNIRCLDQQMLKEQFSRYTADRYFLLVNNNSSASVF